MLPAYAPLDLAAPPKSVRAERRSTRRYPLSLQVRYRFIRQGRIAWIGFGQTINISSHGVLFEAENLIAGTGRIELALKWPFPIGDACYLQLIMRGYIVRMDNRKVAVCAGFHEFRTVSSAAFK